MNKRNTILLSFAFFCIFLLAGSASATIFPVNEAVITVDDDGPADYNTIQAAVDAAASGDTIYVYNGRYHENIIISKSLTLLGQNEANVIIDGDGSGNCIQLSSSDVIVNGFTITNASGYGLNAVSSDLNVENVTITDNTKSGIHFKSGKAFTIRNSRIDGNGGGIIYEGNAATGNAVVEDNTIINNVGSGIHIGLVEGKSATIRNNKIDNNAGTSSDGMYVGISGTGGMMTIQNNPVANSSRYGMYLVGVKSGSTIADFTIQGSGSDGLRADSSDLNLENVTTINNDGRGIYLVNGKGFTIRNSTIDENGGGIVYGNNAFTGDAVVEDNTITNNVGSGINIVLVEGKSATIRNNKIDNNAGTSSDGISVGIFGTGGMMTIQNNPVANSGRYGMYLVGVKSGSTIADFTIQGSGSDGLRADSSDLNLENVTTINNDGRGIYLVKGKGFTIRNSQIDGNGGGIIYAGSAATGDAIVEDNTITNNLGSGIHIELVERKSATIRNNKIDNNAGTSSDGISVDISGTGGMMTIQNNPVANSGRYGMYLVGVKSGSTIADFTIQGSGSDGLRADSSDLNLENVTTINNDGRGIYLVNGKGFTIRNSTIDENGGGIVYGNYAFTGDAVVEDNTITNNVGSGIHIGLVEGKSATIKNNEIDNNTGSYSDGIYCNIAGTGGIVTIENNSVTNSGDDGIHLTGAKNSVLLNNNISTNAYGIRLYSSLSNLIYHNNFKNNLIYNAYDNGESNSWDDGYSSGGNYWEDYNGEDVDNDGIGDTPYNISGTAGAQDQYPLMEPWNGIDSDPDITDPVINSVTLNPTDPITGDDITVTVTATDNVGVTNVTANGEFLSYTGEDDTWEGIITAIEGNHTVNVSVSDAAVNTVYNDMASYTATTPTVDITDPVINSVTLNPTDPITGDDITVTVTATDNVGLTNVTANGEFLSYTGEDDTWEGIITAIEGNHTVNVSVSDAAVNTVYNDMASYTATTPTVDITDPVINSVTLNPTDPITGDDITVTVTATDNVGVTNVIADGVSLINDGGDDIWEGTITAINGTNTVNISASDAATNTVYDETASYTATTPADTTAPEINSVTLDTTNPNTGDDITVTVTATDNVAVTDVTADDVFLSYISGDDTWEGTITAIEGNHTVNVSASDAAGNTVYDETANYTATGSTLPVLLVEDVTAVPNGYAFTSIMVNNVTGLGSGNITVTYDPSVVHVTNVTSGDGNALAVQDWNVDNTTGSVRIFAQDADESHNGDVVLAIVNFHAVGEYPDSTALAISSSELIDYTSYGIIGHSVTNGTFSIIDDEPPVITDAIATPDVILNDNGRPRIPGTDVTVLNATVLNGGSGVTNVTINLSSIGGSDDQVMERIADTDVWTVATNATEGINLTHELVVTASDGAGNTNTSEIGLTVLLRGDVVRDGDLNSADALYIAKYLVGKEPSPSLLVSDMSPDIGDGKVTSADALYLAKYLVGKEVAP